MNFLDSFLSNIPNINLFWQVIQTASSISRDLLYMSLLVNENRYIQI